MVTKSHEEVQIKGNKDWYQNPCFQWLLAYYNQTSAVIDLAQINFLS
jgi:hypothetical protein